MLRGKYFRCLEKKKLGSKRNFGHFDRGPTGDGFSLSISIEVHKHQLLIEGGPSCPVKCSQSHQRLMSTLSGSKRGRSLSPVCSPKADRMLSSSCHSNQSSSQGLFHCFVPSHHSDWWTGSKLLETHKVFVPLRRRGRAMWTFERLLESLRNEKKLPFAGEVGQKKKRLGDQVLLSHSGRQMNTFDYKLMGGDCWNEEMWTDSAVNSVN